MPKRLIVGIASAALFAAGCASSNSHSKTPAGGTTTTPASSSSSAPSSSAAAATGTAFIYAAGGHLYTTGGKALYTFTLDTKTAVACTGGCTSYWPPLTGTPKAGGGVSAGDLKLFMRPDGTSQVTFYGKQLYMFAGDSVGTLKGEGVKDNGGTWHAAAASPDDSKINGGASPVPGGGSGASSSSSGGGGYSY